MASSLETDKLGQLVRERLHDRRLTQREAAKVLNINQGDMSRLISGRGRGTAPKIWKKVINFLEIDDNTFQKLHRERIDRIKRGVPVSARLLSEETRIPANTFRKLADLAETMPESSMDFRSLVVVLSAYERDS